MNDFDLQQHGITVEDIRRNLAPAELYAEALEEDPSAAIADCGSLLPRYARPRLFQAYRCSGLRSVACFRRLMASMKLRRSIASWPAAFSSSALVPAVARLGTGFADTSCR